MPWQHLTAYADRSGLDPDAAEMFRNVIRAMDTAWLDWQAETAERDRKKQQD